MGLFKKILSMDWDEDCEHARSALYKKDKGNDYEKITACEEKIRRGGLFGTRCDDDCPKDKQ